MKSVKPIVGGQPTPTPTPTPNPPAPECIRVQKVYDWILATNTDTNKVPIPTTCIAAVDAALAVGDELTIDCALSTAVTPNPNFRVVRITPNACTINGVSLSAVRVLFTAVLTVTIFDVTTGTVLCTFDTPIRFTDDFCLCVPDTFTTANIFVEITAFSCSPTTDVLFDHMVELEVTICKQIEVMDFVKLEVFAKFCQPRPNIPIPTPGFQCPPVIPAPQCPTIFPVPNCSCQAFGTVTGTATPTVITFAPTATGTESLFLNICPECNPSFSTFTYTFTETGTTVTPVTPTPFISFTLTPTTISTPTCTPGTIVPMVITGEGVLQIANDGSQPVTYTIVVISPTQYTVTIMDLAGVPIFVSGPLTAPVGAFTIGACGTVVP